MSDFLVSFYNSVLQTLHFTLDTKDREVPLTVLHDGPSSPMCTLCGAVTYTDILVSDLPLTPLSMEDPASFL